MSDNEYYSGSDSDSEDSSVIEVHKKNNNKLIGAKTAISNIDTYEEDSDREIDDDVNDDNDEEAKIEDVSDVDDDCINYDIDDDEVEENDDDNIEDDEDMNEESNKVKTLSKNIKGGENQKKNIPLQIDSGDDDDLDDLDDVDENYLQKFDSEITKNYINDYHPECFVHNYEEISNLTKIVRDSNNIIIDPFHKTIPFLTKYERARILGQRAKQIESGAKPFIKIPSNIIDSYIIAELELQQKRIPFIIRRPLSNGSCEYWNVKDLENISF